ncbi:MAG: hypothetical protein IKF90_16800 [Parasporobacterium sp.]|nr:hypothetical protein [Parasporobacterium sp.]
MDNIIQEIRSGNKEAVKSVYQEYAKDVYNFAKSITGDHDSALAATKKTFLTLFKNIQDGEEPANLRTAALKIAYDEAYRMAAPKKEEVPEEEEEPFEAEAVEEEAAEEAPEEPVYAEPIFQKRERRPNRRELPPVDDDFDDGYESETFDDEEDDDFVPPKRAKDADREEVYIPKGGFDTLKIDPIEVPDEEPEERDRRRRRLEDEEEYIEQPERRPRKRRPEEEAQRPKRRPAPEPEVYTLDDEGNERDDYYDDYEEDDEEEKPRNKGLFIFCVILNIILILILLWFLGGLLVNLGILPDIDIGYSWFNAHIYPLF